MDAFAWGVVGAAAAVAAVVAAIVFGVIAAVQARRKDRSQLPETSQAAVTGPVSEQVDQYIRAFIEHQHVPVAPGRSVAAVGEVPQRAPAFQPAGRRSAAPGGSRTSTLGARTWTISQVRVVVDGKVTVKDAPKTEASARALPLDAALVAALRALRKRQLGERLAAGEAYTDSGYVVSDELGNAINPEWLSDEFERVAKRAGVRRMTPHNARHTALTLMEQSGLPVSLIAAWAGHKDHSFTMKRYVHKPTDLAPALDALSQVYGG